MPSVASQIHSTHSLSQLRQWHLHPSSLGLKTWMPGPWLQGLPFHPQGSLRIRLKIQRSYLGPGQPRGHSWDLMGTGKRLNGRQRRGSSEGGGPGQWWGVILKPGAPIAEHPASLRDPPDEPQAPPTPDSIRMKILKDQD